MTQTITQSIPRSGATRWIRVAIALVLGVVLASGVSCDRRSSREEIRQLLASGNPRQALDPLRDLVGENPDDPEVLFLYGRVLALTGQAGLAEWPLRKAMEDPDWYERAATQVAATAIDANNFENAAEILAEVLERNPENVEVRLMRADACAAAPRLLQEAVDETDRIFELDPEEFRAYKPRIIALLSMNREEEARETLEELGERIATMGDEDDPLRGWHCATMAIFADDLGDEELAAERWTTCEQEFPTHSNVVAQSLAFHDERNDFERSLAVAQAAFAGDPSIERGYRVAVADRLVKLGRVEEAEALLREAVEEEETADTMEAWLALAQYYIAVNRPSDAIPALERALELGEDSHGPQPDLVFSLGDLMIQTGQYDRALALADDDRMSVAAHRALVRARVAHARERYAEALDLYEETTRLWPSNPYAPYHSSRAAMSIGAFDRALDDLFLTVRIDERATDARLRAARLLAAEGKWQSAFEILSTGTRVGTVEAELFLVEVVTQLKGRAAGWVAAQQLGQRQPRLQGLATAVHVDAVADLEGGEVAWSVIEPVLEVELPPVSGLPILGAATKWAPGPAELDRVEPLITGVAETLPEEPATHELQGLYRERREDRPGAIESYRQALALEPNLPSVQLRLARLVASEDPIEAAELIEPNLVEGRFDPDLFLAAIDELPDSAERRGLLERALRADPIEGRVALRLAEALERTPGSNPRRVLALADRSIRFQGGSRAIALRERVGAQARASAGKDSPQG